jgi:signal transduction histidine kinase
LAADGLQWFSCGIPAESSTPPEVEAPAYFVACEALTNVVKHAHASQADVSVIREDGLLRLQMRDDGLGMNGAGAHGHRLTNLRDRVEAALPIRAADA